MNSSLHRVFIIPFVLLVSALALSVGWVSYRAGDEAAEELSRRVLLDLIGRINQATERHLLGSEIALNTVAPEPIPMAGGRERTIVAFSDDLSQLEDRLWIATGLFPEVNRYVYFGGEDGRFAGVNRLPGNMYELRLRGPGEEFRRVYSMAGPHERLALLHTQKYEPKQRPWYGNAVTAGKMRWSPVYSDFTTLEPVLTLSKPVYRADKTLIGVIATDMPLRQLTDFFKTLSVSENGVALIVEPSGALIATSGRELPFKVENKALVRLMATESAAPLAREAFEKVMQWQKAGSRLAQPVTHEYNSADGKVQVAATVLQNAAGLNWITIVALPRSDFMARVTRSVYQNFAIGLIAVLLTLLLGVVILRWVLRDIRKLTQAAKSIGGGEPFQPLGIDRRDEIGQLAQSFQEMERDLRTDKLTDVLNRESLIAQVEFRLRNVTDVIPLRFGLLFIDLDGFKLINDRYGHAAGDRVLIEVAARLKTTLRTDDKVARFGGDEFVVFLHAIESDADMHSVCEKIRTVVELPIAVRDDANAQVGASIGSALYPSDGRDIETLLRVADGRMFMEKKAHKRF